MLGRVARGIAGFRAASATWTDTLLGPFRTFGWAAFSQFGRQALQLASLIVLARLLAPQDFGVMSLATVVTGFVSLFRDMGTGAVLIHRQAAGAPLVRTVSTLNVLLSVAGGLLTAVSAPVIARFFASPILEPVLQVLAVSLAVAGLGVAPQAVMEREGRFDRLARIELGGVATGVVTGIAMAYHGWGIWSLVGQTVVATFMTTVLLTTASGARPTLRPDSTLLRGIAGYSLNLAGFNVFNYFVRNADNVIIGKLLGPQELGYYALAYQIAIGPVRSIGGVVSRVLFPSLARLQHDRRALRREYLRAVGLMVSVCLPLMALLVALAHVGTLALLGESWMPMVPILVVLGLIGFVQSASVTIGALYMATGRTDVLMRWGLVTGTLAILAFWIGAQWGALGVAVAYAVFMVGITYHCFSIPFRLVGMRVGDVLRISARPAVGSFVTALIAWLIARRMEGPAGTMGALISGALGGSLFYLAWYVTGRLSILPKIPASKESGIEG
ncbi:MAG TPA: lipopolysaccharide biosynthesis protein [Burkholderiales bacterium]|jgi:lipopolysaccharide exporter